MCVCVCVFVFNQFILYVDIKFVSIMSLYIAAELVYQPMSCYAGLLSTVEGK